jgi:DNA-binding MarR family transcriptional regulator
METALMPSRKRSLEDVTHALLAVQQSYPQIWFFCHVEHQTRSRSQHQLTDRELGILAHLTEPEFATDASKLRQHLGIGKAALSVHFKRLAQLELLSWVADDNDRRKKHPVLSTKALSVLRTHGPLDADRLELLLRSMDASARSQAIIGLQHLAAAARALSRSIGS